LLSISSSILYLKPCQKLIRFYCSYFLFQINTVIKCWYDKECHEWTSKQTKYNSVPESCPECILQCERKHSEERSDGCYDNWLQSTTTSCHKCFYIVFEFKYFISSISCESLYISIDSIQENNSIIYYNSCKRYKSYSKCHTIGVPCYKESYIYSEKCQYYWIEDNKWLRVGIKLEYQYRKYEEKCYKKWLKCRCYKFSIFLVFSTSRIWNTIWEIVWFSKLDQFWLYFTWECSRL